MDNPSQKSLAGGGGARWLCISLALSPLCGHAAQVEFSRENLQLATVQLDRLFVLVFAPILGAIVSILLWRAWKHISKSQK